MGGASPTNKHSPLAPRRSDKSRRHRQRADMWSFSARSANASHPPVAHQAKEPLLSESCETSNGNRESRCKADGHGPGNGWEARMDFLDGLATTTCSQGNGPSPSGATGTTPASVRGRIPQIAGGNPLRAAFCKMHGLPCQLVHASRVCCTAATRLPTQLAHGTHVATRRELQPRCGNAPNQ